MAGLTGVIQRAFGGGELAPALHARADQVKYTTGLKTCLNFLVERAGGVSNRPGTRYVATCKTNSPTVLLMPYISELAGGSILIEVGAGYLRFFKNTAAIGVAGVPAYAGATSYVIGDIVSSGGVNYYAIAPSLAQAPPNATFWYAMPAGNLLELPNPFGQLFAWSQSGRTLTLTAQNAAPVELTYEADTRWILKGLVTAPVLLAPQNLLLTVGAAGTRKYAYVVTAARAGDFEESAASGQVIDFTGAEPTANAPNALTWDVVADAAEYYVYCDAYANGIFGFVGTASSNSFKDAGFVPDFTITPPITRAMFGTANDRPAVSATFQQRRWFADTINDAEAIFASRTGLPRNFGISSPLQDDDALTFRIAGGQHNPIRHLVPLKQLVVLTDTSGWLVHGDASGVIAPATIGADQHIYAGASSVRPVIIGNSILYVQARGSIIRDLQFDINVEGFAGRDLTVYSSHLFDSHTIRDLDYQQTPHSIAWAVRDDGALLGCTYLREQDVWGWHRHTTGRLNADGSPGDAFFWSVCVVPETDEDAVYFIVRRTINGATVRYIERLAARAIVNFDADAYFVDCGLSYAGAPVSNVSGLAHLQGQCCAVVGDGAVIFNGDPLGAGAGNFVVTAGGTFPTAFPGTYSNIHVGLRYVPELETLDLDTQGAAIRDKKKRVGAVDVLLADSSRTFQAGPDATHLKTIVVSSFEPTGDTFSGQVEINLTSAFDKSGRVLIRQPQPLPLTILGIIPQVELGG